MHESTDIFLRLICKDDAFMTYLWELTEDAKNVTQIQNKVSLVLIYELIEEQQNFRDSGQTRFVICLKENKRPIGTIDLYDFNVNKGLASVGILIAEKEMRNKGYAKEAILQLHQIANKQLGIKYLEAKVQISNVNSIGFFESIGYTKIVQEEVVSDAIIYQFKL